MCSPDALGRYEYGILMFAGLGNRFFMSLQEFQMLWCQFTGKN